MPPQLRLSGHSTDTLMNPGKTCPEARPIGCTQLPFRPQFFPFGTWLWTFYRVDVQSTQWERFIWTLPGVVDKLVGYQGPYFRN